MKAAFPDCAFPDDCQCAQRGYQDEADHCLVPRVREAAEAVGLNPSAVVSPKEAKPPRLKAIPKVGTVMLLGEAGGEMMFIYKLQSHIRRA